MTTWKNITLTYSINGNFLSRIIQEVDNSTEMEFSRIRYYPTTLQVPKIENSIGDYNFEIFVTFSIVGISLIIIKQQKSSDNKKHCVWKKK